MKQRSLKNNHIRSNSSKDAQCYHHQFNRNKKQYKKPFFGFNQKNEPLSTQFGKKSQQQARSGLRKYEDKHNYPLSQDANEFSEKFFKQYKSLQIIKNSISSLKQTLNFQKNKIKQQQLLISIIEEKKSKKNQFRNFYQQLNLETKRQQLLNINSPKSDHITKQDLDNNNLLLYSSIKRNFIDSFKILILAKKGNVFSNQLVDIGFRIIQNKLLVVLQTKREILQLKILLSEHNLTLKEQFTEKTYFQQLPGQRIIIELQIQSCSLSIFTLPKLHANIQTVKSNSQFFIYLPITPFSFLQFCQPIPKIFKGTTQWFFCRVKQQKKLEIELMNVFKKGYLKYEDKHFIGFRNMNEKQLYNTEFQFKSSKFRIKGDTNIKLFQIVNFIIELFVEQIK